MMKRMRSISLVAGLAACGWGLAGCRGENGDAGADAASPAQALAEAAADALPEPPAPRGPIHEMASLVPADAEWFAAGSLPEGWLEDQLAALREKEFWQGLDPQERQNIVGSLELAARHVGREWFAFGNPGLAPRLAAGGVMSHEWEGIYLGTMLRAATTSFSMAFDEDSFDSLHALMMEEGERAQQAMALGMERMIRPSADEPALEGAGLVLGWRPEEGAAEETVARMRQEIDGWLDREMREEAAEALREISFVSGGVEMRGYEIDPSLLPDPPRVEPDPEEPDFDPDFPDLQFADPMGMQDFQRESLQRIQEAALETRPTVALGTHEGRVFLFVGNGSEACRLVEDPATSLAERADFAPPVSPDAASPQAMFHASRELVAACQPWIDPSPRWRVLSARAASLMPDRREIHDLLLALSDLEARLAERTPAAWNAVLWQEDGLRIETAGGWPDPGLDYAAPLAMAPAAAGLDPALRAHWVQNPAHHDLAATRLDLGAALLAASLEPLKEIVLPSDRVDEDPEVASQIERAMAALTRATDRLSRSYAEDFRGGVGPEVAVVMDFRGEVPPVPGIPATFVNDGRIPRAIVARPVTDRAKIEATGAVLEELTTEFTTLAREISDTEIPLVLPQSASSGDLVTWFVPLPFIGGDFVPGATVGDSLWTLGTSRSLTRDFARGLEAGGSPETGGLRVEADFTQFWDWIDELEQREDLPTGELLAGLSESLPEGVDADREIEEARKSLRSLRGMSYWHRLEDGVPRTSVHFHVAAE